jgi:hypothetical protein
VDVVDVPASFTLASLIAAGHTTLVFSYPTFSTNPEYTAAERQAVVDFVTQGHGGVVGLWLIYYDSNLPLGLDLAPLLGLNAASLVQLNPSSLDTVTVAQPAHPIALGLPASFDLLTHPYQQGTSGTWAAALLANATIVAQASNGSAPIIAHEGANWRSVYYGGLADFEYQNTATAQSLYNAIYWTSGFD